MQEQAHIMAVAFNDPKSLDKMFKPSVRELTSKAETDPEAWDYDDWWNTQS